MFIITGTCVVAVYVYYNWRVCCGFMFIITGVCVVAVYVYYNWRVCCGCLCLL